MKLAVGLVKFTENSVRTLVKADICENNVESNLLRKQCVFFRKGDHTYLEKTRLQDDNEADRATSCGMDGGLRYLSWIGWICCVRSAIVWSWLLYVPEVDHSYHRADKQILMYCTRNLHIADRWKSSLHKRNANTVYPESKRHANIAIIYRCGTSSLHFFSYVVCVYLYWFHSVTVSWISRWTKDSSSFLRCGMALPSLGWTFKSNVLNGFENVPVLVTHGFAGRTSPPLLFLFFSSWTEEVDTSIKLARFMSRCSSFGATWG